MSPILCSLCSLFNERGINLKNYNAIVNNYNITNLYNYDITNIYTNVISIY